LGSAKPRMAEEVKPTDEFVRIEAGTEQFSRKFEGQLNRFAVIVDDGAMAEELSRKGYGNKEEKALSLKLYESLHLVRLGWLSVKAPDGADVSFEAIVQRSIHEDPLGWTKFLVYRDLRSRGYVAREGYGLAADLRVYPRGEYGRNPAKFVVIPINEGGDVKLSKLQKMIDAVYRMGKEPIIAVVERRGEAIYYRASKMVFEGP
jgi:tRNA-intron endonuclease